MFQIYYFVPIFPNETEYFCYFIFPKTPSFPDHPLRAAEDAAGAMDSMVFLEMIQLQLQYRARKQPDFYDVRLSKDLFSSSDSIQPFR